MPTNIAGREGSIQDVFKGRAQTESVIETDMEDRNEQGFAWSMPIDAVDPTGANDIFAYLQNTDPSQGLHVRRIRVSSTVPGMLEVIRVTGTAVSGSPVTLVNFNQNHALATPEGLFETGADITGLADGGKYAFQELAVANTTYDLRIPHDVILGKNGAIGLNWVPATGILSGTIWFFVHE